MTHDTTDTSEMAPPLDATRRRISGIFRLFTFDLTPGPDDPRWINIAAASQPEHLATRIEQLAARYDGHRDVAAAYVAMRAASVVTAPLIGAWLLERRVPLLHADHASVRVDDTVEFSRLATGTNRFLALQDDPDIGHRDVTVATEPTLVDTLADTIEHLLTPLLTELRALAPFGRRGLWGLTADSIGGCAIASARETRTDHRPAWSAATGLLDELQARHVPVNNRPRPLVVSCDGHEFAFSIRGTCCLRYKADNPSDHHDPEFGAYCHSCPLIDDDTLQRHYVDNARERLSTSD